MPGTALEETGFPGPPVLFPRPDPSLWLLAAAPESGGQGREWQGRPGHWPCGVTGGEVPGGVHVAKGREGNERQPVSRPNLLPGTGRPPGARPGPARVLPDSSGRPTANWKAGPCGPSSLPSTNPSLFVSSVSLQRARPVIEGAPSRRSCRPFWLPWSCCWI